MSGERNFVETRPAVPVELKGIIDLDKATWVRVRQGTSLWRPLQAYLSKQGATQSFEVDHAVQQGVKKGGKKTTSLTVSGMALGDEEKTPLTRVCMRWLGDIVEKEGARGVFTRALTLFFLLLFFFPPPPNSSLSVLAFIVLDGRERISIVLSSALAGLSVPMIAPRFLRSLSFMQLVSSSRTCYIPSWNGCTNKRKPRKMRIRIVFTLGRWRRSGGKLLPSSASVPWTLWCFLLRPRPRFWKTLPTLRATRALSGTQAMVFHTSAAICFTGLQGR